MNWPRENLQLSIQTPVRYFDCEVVLVNLQLSIQTPSASLKKDMLVLCLFNNNNKGVSIVCCCGKQL